MKNQKMLLDLEVQKQVEQDLIQRRKQAEEEKK